MKQRSAEILCIGTEILMGDIINTNAAYIAKELAGLGINVYHQSVVGDNPQRLKESLALAFSRADIVITTGGLGPTYDDLSKETIAAYFNRKLVMDEESLHAIECHFLRLNRVMTDNNKKQAMMPEGCVIFANHNGTAPGCAIEGEGEQQGKTAIMLPGPPREMKPMFEQGVKPFLLKDSDTRLVSHTMHFFGIGESMLESILHELMEAELDASLGYEKNQKGDSVSSNKRNGHSQKTLKSQYGEFQIDVPRDRNGEFEPKLIPKYQRDISGIEDKVISLYSRGLSTRDIHDQLQDLYGIELSAEMVSKITDRILPEIKEWQSRPLNPIYPFVFMDCIHYKVREEGRILSRAAYVVLGVTTEGYKEILSITVGANETSKFWLGMLNDLKNRGVQDVLFFCVDGLPGFKDAIQAVYPQAQIQRCVIHMLRNSFKYVNYNDLKKFSADFKAVYNAPTEAAALAELEAVKEKWGKKYPYAVSNWENNWEDVSSFFQFSGDIRRIMYTTNIIEGLNRQYRKVTKTKSVFPSDSALEKMLYLASGNVTKKWTQRYRNWDQVLSQLILLYPERLTPYL